MNSSEQLSNEESLNQSVEQLVSNRHSELKCQLNKNNDDGIILKEEKQNENVSILTWFKLLNYGIGITGVAIIILLAWIWGSSNILISYFIGIWLKESQSDSNNRMYFTLFFNLIIIWFLSSVLLVATTYGVLLISSFKLHKKMIWKVIRAPSIFFDANPIGRIITRFSRDISILDYMIGFSLNIFSNGFIKVFGVLIFIWINFPYMLISLSIVALFMYLVQRRCYLAQNESQRIDAITKAPINTKILSAIDGLNTIRAFHKEKHFIDKFICETDKNGNAMFMFCGVSRHMGVLIDMLSLIFIMTNSLLIVFLKNETKTLNPITASIAIQLSLEIPFNLSYAIKYWTETNNLMISAQRIIEYANMKSEDDIIKKNDPEIFPLAPDIKFDNVTMRYRENLIPVLKNVSYHVQPGWKIGIIGRTGAGKSSILQAIFRLTEIDHDGKIEIGGINIKDIGLHCLRNSISFVPQTPFLMATTIRENLDPFTIYSDKEIWNALDDLHLK